MHNTRQHTLRQLDGLTSRRDTVLRNDLVRPETVVRGSSHVQLRLYHTVRVLLSNQTRQQQTRIITLTTVRTRSTHIVLTHVVLLLTLTLTLTFDLRSFNPKPQHFIGYPKVIPYIKF